MTIEIIDSLTEAWKSVERRKEQKPKPDLHLQVILAAANHLVMSPEVEATVEAAGRAMEAAGIPEETIEKILEGMAVAIPALMVENGGDFTYEVAMKEWQKSLGDRMPTIFKGKTFETPASSEKVA